MGRDAAISPPSASAKLLGEFDVLLLLDAAADGDDDFRLREIDGLLGFLEDLRGLLRMHAVGDLDVYGFDRAAHRPSSAWSPRKAPFWNVTNHGPSPAKRHVGGELALEHLPGEEQLAALVLVADGVADQRAASAVASLGAKSRTW